MQAKRTFHTAIMTTKRQKLPLPEPYHIRPSCCVHFNVYFCTTLYLYILYLLVFSLLNVAICAKPCKRKRTMSNLHVHSRNPWKAFAEYLLQQIKSRCRIACAQYKRKYSSRGRKQWGNRCGKARACVLNISLNPWFFYKKNIVFALSIGTYWYGPRARYTRIILYLLLYIQPPKDRCQCRAAVPVTDRRDAEAFRNDRKNYRRTTRVSRSWRR